MEEHCYIIVGNIMLHLQNKKVKSSISRDEDLRPIEAVFENDVACQKKLVLRKIS